MSPTKTTTRSDWRKEFGPHYNVPRDVTAKTFDVSWHNDASPSFVLAAQDADDPHTPRLWVEHPSPEQREVGGTLRYTVAWSPEDTRAKEVVVETDVVTFALATLKLFTLERRRERAETAAALHLSER